MNVQKVFRITNLKKIIRETRIGVDIRREDKILEKSNELPLQLQRKSLLPIVALLAPEKEVSPVKRIIRGSDLQALEKGADGISIFGQIAINRKKGFYNGDFETISLTKLLKVAAISIPEEIESTSWKKLTAFFEALNFPKSLIFLLKVEPEERLTMVEPLSPLKYLALYFEGGSKVQQKLIKTFQPSQKWLELFREFDENSKLAWTGVIQRTNPDFYINTILPWLKGESGNR